MDGQEILEEYLFIKFGYADEVDGRTGVHVGLDLELQERMAELEKTIIGCIGHNLAVVEMVG